jgi:CRISP-associated protein Cas1
MNKATLIVDEAQSRLSLNQDVIVLEQPTGARHRIGLRAIQQIIVQGDVSLSSKLLESCLAAGISFVLLPGRPRDPARHLLPQPHGALSVRLAQYAAYLDPAQRLDLARSFVISKEASINCFPIPL